MLLVPTELRASTIHGLGVFLLMPVKQNELVWRFDTRLDIVLTDEAYKSLPAIVQKSIYRYLCWHEANKLWVMCGDNARHFNHSETPSTITTGSIFGQSYAVRDLNIGDEITNDYRSVCDITRITGEL